MVSSKLQKGLDMYWLNLALMVISLLVTLFIVNLHNNGHLSPKAPRWLHVLILDYLARLLFMSSKHVSPSVEVILNPYSKGMSPVPDISGEAMRHVDAGEKDDMVGSAVVGELKKVARDVLAMRLRMEQHLRTEEDGNDWMLIAKVFDRLLFVVYTTVVILQIDASAVGAGAVLLQENDAGVEHPVCYFSKKFSKCQRNYSTIEKEALALDWVVPFLRWDNDTCGTNKLSYPKSELWLPDIQIQEFMDEDKSPDLPYLQLNYTGGVHLVQLKRVVASCKMDIYTFPFDVQECALTFLSYVLEEDEMTLTSKSLKFSFNSSVVSDSGWKFVNLKMSNSTYSLTSIRTFFTLKYNITLKREASLYVVNLLVPSCFLSLLDLFSFFLTPENSERSAFKITLILGYIVFLLIINDLLPTSSETTPLISVFFSISLALMVISLLVTMFIVNLHNNGHLSPKAPRWLHVLILDYLARLLFMSPKHLAPSEEVILNPHSKVMPDISGEAMTPIDAGEKDDMLGSAVVGELKKVARDVLAMRQRMEQHLRTNEDGNDWMLIAKVFDRLLFVVYTIVVIGHIRHQDGAARHTMALQAYQADLLRDQSTGGSINDATFAATDCCHGETAVA
ncbi:5-hydroxytryptamine receptor 3A-like [Clarias gariepinus]